MNKVYSHCNHVFEKHPRMIRLMCLTCGTIKKEGPHHELYEKLKRSMKKNK